jgi:glycosyltransferase involved in cell wall biosynthesis
MNSKKYKSLIFGPIPPPVGGIGTIVTMLHKGLADREDIGFAIPLSKNSGWKSMLARPVINIIRLIFSIYRTESGGKILLFSGEARSFLEKMVWSIFILALGRKPVVFMVSGLFPIFWENLKPNRRQFFSSIICHKNFTLVAQSKNWFSYYQSIFPTACIKIAGATVAEEFFNHQRNSNLSIERHRLLFIGWITPEKGILDLLDAMVILIRSFPDLILRLVGPLFGKDDVWTQAVDIRGISNNVEFLGSIANRQKLIQEFDSASIFVFPSHYEGFPVALLEAATMGLPCIGTFVGGIPDILDNGQAGLLVEPKKPQELADALYKLIIDQDIREKISKRASERAREVYNYPNFIKSFECLLGLK